MLVVVVVWWDRKNWKRFFDVLYHTILVITVSYSDTLLILTKKP